MTGLFEESVEFGMWEVSDDPGAVRLALSGELDDPRRTTAAGTAPERRESRAVTSESVLSARTSGPFDNESGARAAREQRCVAARSAGGVLHHQGA